MEYQMSKACNNHRMELNVYGDYARGYLKTGDARNIDGRYIYNIL
jgi:hypothetical protein